MIDTSGMVSVAEASKRLKKSTEQVRRDLRDRKLKGQRIGNQWFVDEAALGDAKDNSLVPPELLNRIARRAAAISKRNPDMPDVVDMLRESRDGR
jgi:hypothetical protein